MTDPAVIILSVIAVGLLAAIFVGCYYIWDAHRAQKAFRRGGRAR